MNENSAVNPEYAKKLISDQLQIIGEDIKREGLVQTPNRVVKSWNEIYSGYEKKAADVLTTFSADGHDQMVVLKNIELYSMCEHHMLPFFGKAHVGYLPDPNGKIVGISKLARLVDIYARRLQIQERIGEQVVDDLMKYLQPLGAICVIEATHMCMRMRGVGKQNSTMVTSAVRGLFREEASVRNEFFSLIKND